MARMDYLARAHRQMAPVEDRTSHVCCSRDRLRNVAPRWLPRRTIEYRPRPKMSDACPCSMPSFLHLQPELDQAADGLGAARLVVLRCGPCVDLSNELV